MQISSVTCSNRSGYTLAELLIVLVILGLSAALIAPNLFRQSPGHILRQTETRLETAIRSAQTRARLTGEDSVVILDVETREVRFQPERDVITLPREIEFTATVAEAELDGDLAGIRFFSEGGSTGATILMELDGRARALRVDWVTGQMAEISPDEIE